MKPEKYPADFKISGDYGVMMELLAWDDRMSDSISELVHAG